MGEHISPIENAPESSAAQRAQVAKKAGLAKEIRQQASKALFENWAEHSAFNPLAQQKQFKTLKERETKPTAETSKPEAKPEAKTDSNKAENVAKFYQQRNAELSARSLMTLNAQVQNAVTVHEVIERTYELFSDPALADEALDYLLETLPPGSRAHERAKEAKTRLNQLRGREVRSGRNMGDIARAHTELANPTALRDLYRDITGNPRDATTLFEELIQKFNFNKMKEAIDFILKALRSDLTAKGSSISHGELKSLIDEARNMQAILGVYSFFLGRSNLVVKEFIKNNMSINPKLHFESLAKQLVRLLKEPYPSPTKVFALSNALGIRNDIIAQIIIFTQFRDAMRGVSPRLFKNEKHRQDMLMTLIEALAELEDALDEEEE
ncbi:MAG: hypothetical protein KDK50_04650 [Chlamydiia bacterium]|nr:hypothetical protein [Chlamydiia bacterium]